MQLGGQRRPPHGVAVSILGYEAGPALCITDCGRSANLQVRESNRLRRRPAATTPRGVFGADGTTLRARRAAPALPEIMIAAIYEAAATAPILRAGALKEMRAARGGEERRAAGRPLPAE